MISKLQVPSFQENALKLLRERRQCFLREARGLQSEWTPDLIHDVRVACRRFRSALRIFLPFLDTESAGALQKVLRNFMRKFNALRDVDVQIELINSLKIPRRKSLRMGFDEINSFLAARKRDLDEKVRKFAAGAFIGDEFPLPAFAATHSSQVAFGVRSSMLPEIDEAVARSRAIPWDNPVENIYALHSLRIQIKRVRYGLEFFLIEFGEYGKKLLNRFKKIQDVLGWIHDCDILALVLKKILKSRARERYKKTKTVYAALPWPEFSSKTLPIVFFFEKEILLPVVLRILRQLSKIRSGHMKSFRKELELFEKLRWNQSIVEWLEKGICPTEWRKELAKNDK